MEIEVKRRNYKKDALGAIICLLILAVIYILGYDMFPLGTRSGLAITIGVTIGLLMSMLTMKDKSKEYEFIILPLLLIINHFLFKNDMAYIPNNFVLYFGLTGLGIYYLYKSNTLQKNTQITIVIFLLIGVLGLEYYMYTNRLIKDINFDRHIRKEYNLSRGYKAQDLENIQKLSIGQNKNIISLKGIQHFDNLEKLYISDLGNNIRDFRNLGQLNIRELTLWFINLDNLKDIEDMDSLEKLEVLYHKVGQFNGLESFPNLKELYVQGIWVDDLTALKGPKNLESLFLGFGEVKSFEGIEEFVNLKELRLSMLEVKDLSDILLLENLELVVFDGMKREATIEIRNELTKRGINVSMINAN